jgi:polyferredoxin
MVRHRRQRRGLHRYRRLFQIFFLLAFLTLLTLTFWPLGEALVSAFLLADPLMTLNSVANGVVRWEFLLAVPVLISPLFIGRAFCAYACPMGFMIELFGPRRERHPGPRVRKVMRKIPAVGLVVVVVLILFGSAAFLVFDPISLFTRSASTLVYPTVDRALRLAGDVLYLAPPLRGGVDSITEVLTGRLVFSNGLAYRLQLVILLMFAGVLALSWIERRMWCRHLCPLGALLGLVGRGAIFGRVIDERAEPAWRRVPWTRSATAGIPPTAPVAKVGWSVRTPARRMPSAGDSDPANSMSTIPVAGRCSKPAA